MEARLGVRRGDSRSRGDEEASVARLGVDQIDRRPVHGRGGGDPRRLYEASLERLIRSPVDLMPAPQFHQRLASFLESPAASLPASYEEGFEEHVQERFERYFKDLDALGGKAVAPDDWKDRLRASRNCANELVTVIRAWLTSRPDEAVQRFAEALKSVEYDLKTLVSDPVTDGKLGPIFRVRVGPLAAGFSRRDLFHIPFDKRDRVRTQRYSFPGLPCLYAGRSTYVCWEEMGRPDLAHIWVSRLVPAREIRVLDLAHRPQLVAAGLDEELRSRGNGMPTRMAEAHAIVWPLLAACSVKRPRDAASGFAVEYVVPQLLLRWIMNPPEGWERIDGLRYFSTRVNHRDVGLHGTNYVFPAGSPDPDGVCRRLRRMFTLTEPENWQVATSLVGEARSLKHQVEKLEISAGKSVEYHSTLFAKVESYVWDLPHAAI